MKGHIGILVAVIFLSASARAQQFTWTGAAGDGLVSNPGNWQGGTAPTGNASGEESLDLSGASSTVVSDITGATFSGLNLRDGVTLTGDSLRLGWIGVSYGFTGSATIALDIRTWDERGAPYFSGFEVHLGSPGFDLAMKGTLEAGVPVAIQSLGARFLLAGENGKIVAAPGTSPSLSVSGGTLSLDNREAVVTARVASTIPVTLDNGTIELLGNADADVVETLGQVKVRQLSTLKAVAESERQAVLSVASLDVGASGNILFDASGGGSFQVGNVAPSAFLGGQYLFSSQSGRYEYAGYDAAAGVVSATTSTDLSTATAQDHVRLDAYTELAGNREVRSLAVNAGLGGTGTVALTDLLVEPGAMGVSVNLDFGSRDGTVTAASQPYSVSLTGDIAGSGSLVFRGNMNVWAAASYAGAVSVQGDMSIGGSMAHASGWTLGSDEGMGGLYFMGPSGAAEMPDRISDTAPITVYQGRVSLVREFGNPAGFTERMGTVTLAAGAGRSLWLESSNYDPVSDSETPERGTLAVAGLIIDAACRNSVIEIIASGKGSSLEISGGEIEVGNENLLMATVTSGARLSTPGIHVTGNASATVSFSGDAELAGDLRVGAAYLTLRNNMSTDDGRLTILGDLELGAESWTNIFCSNRSLITVEGDLTLDGGLYMGTTDGTPITEGSYLLLRYTGRLTDHGWETDPDEWGWMGFSASVHTDETTKEVYLDVVAVPEPSALLLSALGGIVLVGAAARRGRLRRRSADS
ncbi:PEP-CTERM protein-sorting domain-containing protein [Terrimicrobium sacchariphilum]|uniref:PEP-CTERM protein-sorting domain-containing protein n=1 Tax=Terrimicrobium sacchariphilum TaxID=690879 RepID=A0A146G4L5_TERSA|nr:hypothetical protein [Terrimicrobium sacchariphilum]GAT32383.1 PEP-CTERM protein-sorting domain-containing protein [Terrimicrobium sacchariphilum]